MDQSEQHIGKRLDFYTLILYSLFQTQTEHHFHQFFLLNFKLNMIFLNYYSNEILKPGDFRKICSTFNSSRARSYEVAVV